MAPAQSRLAGMTDAAIEELEEAAEKFLNLEDNRKRYAERSKDQREIVVTIMQRLGKDVYRHNGLLIQQDRKDSVKVKRVAKDEKE